MRRAGKLASDSFVISAVNLSSRLKSLVFIPWIVGAVQLDGYGAFVQIFLTAQLVSSLFTFELGMAFPRFLSLGEPADRVARQFATALWPTLAQGALGALAMWAAAGFLDTHLFDGSHADSLRVGSVVVVSNAVFAFTRNFLRARREFKRESLFTLAYEMLPYVAFLVAAVSQGTLYAGVACYAVVDAAVAVVALAFVWAEVGVARPSLALFRRQLRYTAPLALSSVQSALLRRADLYFISFFLGLEATATYNVIYRVAEALSLLVIPVNTQLMSYLAAPWDRGHVAEAKRLLRAVLLLFLLLGCGLVTCLALYFDEIFAVMTGRIAPFASLWLPVALIGVGSLANTARRFSYQLVRLEGSTHHESLFQLAGLVVNVIANTLLIPRFGLTGAAAATLISYGVLVPLIASRYSLGLDRGFVGHVLWCAALTAVQWPVRLAVPPDGVVRLLLSAGLAYSLYLLCVLIPNAKLRALLREEWEAWKTLEASAATTPT